MLYLFIVAYSNENVNQNDEENLLKGNVNNKYMRMCMLLTIYPIFGGHIY